MLNSTAFSCARTVVVTFACLYLMPAGLCAATPTDGADAALRAAGADDVLRQAFARAAYSPDGRDIRNPRAAVSAWAQQQELTASDGLALDSFGYSMSVSGNTALIGAYCRNGCQGAAYVFVQTAGGWTQQAELVAAGGAPGDYFGLSVSVDGDTAVIGAPTKTACSLNGSYQGAAFVFVRSGTTWTQQQELTASDCASSDVFGTSVAVSGNTVLIGAPAKTLRSNPVQGAAYVFVRSGTTWTQQQELAASDGVANQYFGSSVSLSGDTALIGADLMRAGQGAAYIFARAGSAWSQQQELTAADSSEGDSFGNAVSLSGNTAVIGADGRTYSRGAAYVFAASGGTWTEQQELTASDGATGDLFGNSVSVSGSTVAIGAYGRSSSRGAVYLFAPSSVVPWSQQQELAASDGAPGYGFGFSVSTNGSSVLAGAYNQTGAGSARGMGAAYVFSQSSGGSGAPPPPASSLALGTTAVVIASAGGSSSVVLASPSSSAWTATANSPFLHISSGSSSGTGSAVVGFTCDAYTGTGTRVGTLTIATLSLTVTQAGTDYIEPATPVAAVTLISSGLNKPYGVALNGAGNVYIADTGNNAVEEWNAATRQVTTLVSSGLDLPAGVAVDSFGNVYVADTGNNAIKEWSVATQQITTLASAGLSHPSGLAVDGSGNVYIADTDNLAIKEWSAATEQATTLVSTAEGLLDGVAVDVAGDVYIADTGNSAIEVWNAVTQRPSTLVFSGLNSPSGVAVDGSGNLYVADTGNNAIKEWSASTGLVTTLVSTGLRVPSGLAVDGSGNVYVADTYNNAIEEIQRAFIGPASLTEPAAAGTDSLLPALPATASLAGVFAPASDANWLTIQSTTNGVVTFSYSANTSLASRVAHITVLGQQISVTQTVLMAQTISFETLANQMLGTAPFTIVATASSGLPVSFESRTPSVCTVSSSLVSLVAVGTCIIQATQPGNASYTAAVPVSQSFTVIPTVPLPTVTGVIGASAFGAFAVVAPGTWVEIYGSNLASTTTTWTAANFNGNIAPTSLGGVQVSVGGQPAYIDYVSPGQVNAQLSSDVPPGSWQLLVSDGGVPGQPVNVIVKATEPGLLAPPSFRVGGNQYVVAQLADGTYVLPAGAAAGVSSRPARPGETIVIYGIGFGPVVPNTPAGTIAPTPSSQLLGAFHVFFGQTAAQVVYAGLSPGSVGLYQFNVVVPPVADNNLVPISFTLGGAAGSQTLYTAVHQ